MVVSVQKQVLTTSPLTLIDERPRDIHIFLLRLRIENVANHVKDFDRVEHLRRQHENFILELS